MNFSYCTQFETFYWFDCCWYCWRESFSLQLQQVILDGASSVCTQIQQEVARTVGFKYSSFQPRMQSKTLFHFSGIFLVLTILTSFCRPFEIIWSVMLLFWNLSLKNKIAFLIWFRSFFANQPWVTFICLSYNARFFNRLNMLFWTTNECRGMKRENWRYMKLSLI